jgi:hypothetical protein
MERFPADELSDHQIETLMAFGRREADLIEQMEAAARDGDRDLVWQIAQALCRIEDEAKQPPSAA